MEAQDLLNIYTRNSSTLLLAEYLEQNQKHIYVSGSKASFISVLASCITKLHENRHHIILVEDREKASYLQNDIENLLGKNYSAVFPMSYKRPYQFEEIDNANVLERSEVLNKSSEFKDKPFVIISYPEAIAEKVVNKQSLVRHSHAVSQGDQLDLDFLSEVLMDYGFKKSDFVYEAGDFSIRGGIVDVFSFSNEKPYRIELWGNEVESIRTFDPESQLSVDPVSTLILTPDIQTKLHQETRESIFSFLNNPVVWVEDYKYAKKTVQVYYEKCSEKFETIGKQTSETYVVQDPEQLFLNLSLIHI